MKKRIAAVAMMTALVFCAACGGKNEKKFALGEIEGSTYTNSYVGVSFEEEGSWDMAAATEAGEVDYEGAYQIIDFQANNPDTMETINITYQQLSELEREEFDDLSEKECVNEMIKAGGMEASYAQQGFTVNEISAKQVKFLGKKRTAVYSALEYFGMEYYALQIIDFHAGEYMPIITFGCYYDDTTEDLLSLFESDK